MAKSNGKPFDIRVMVQKTKQGAWVSTALFTKVGNPNKVATNYNQGGTIGTFRKTMSGANFTSAYTQPGVRAKGLGVAVGKTLTAIIAVSKNWDSMWLWTPTADHGFSR